ncbi:MAG: sulfite exporter TauE/SafE family protein [Pyrinomonadaceae bacterium]
MITVFFITSVGGVVTGSNSLIAVPVMFQVGIDERHAVATNMFGLVFMAVGGAIPFLRKGAVDVRALSPMIVLTIVGSAMGAAIVGYISNDTIKIIVTVAMFAIVIFTLLGGGRGSKDGGATAGGTDVEEELSTKLHEDTRNFRNSIGFRVFSRWFVDKNSLVVERQTSAPESSNGLLPFAGYLLVFLLSIYGGLYSGGYVTVLTASLVAFFGFSYAGTFAAWILF